MSRIFISHSSHDDQRAIEVRNWLAANGWDDVFLDLDPVRGLAPGERWQNALRAAANRCEASLRESRPASRAACCRRATALIGSQPPRARGNQPSQNSTTRLIV